jgi:hypothetical protein
MILPEPEPARALVQVLPDNSSKPLVGWFEIIRFPSSLSDAGFP